MDTAEELALSAERGDDCPTGLTPEARALWLAKAGDWHAAHDLCQDLPDPAGAWIHAWLHRQEGDDGNAGYWYARAGRPAVTGMDGLDEEWMDMAREFA